MFGVHMPLLETLAWAPSLLGGRLCSQCLIQTFCRCLLEARQDFQAALWSLPERLLFCQLCHRHQTSLRTALVVSVRVQTPSCSAALTVAWPLAAAAQRMLTDVKPGGPGAVLHLFVAWVFLSVSFHLRLTSRCGTCSPPASYPR